MYVPKIYNQVISDPYAGTKVTLTVKPDWEYRLELDTVNEMFRIHCTKGDLYETLSYPATKSRFSYKTASVLKY